MLQLLWKTVWKFLKMVNINLPHNPAIPLVHTYQKEMKMSTHKDLYATIHSSTIQIAEKLNKPYVRQLLNK